jgi:dihydrofolate reductase
MKAILYSGLTANGNYGSSDIGQMPKQEELNDLYMQAKDAGNMVMGRKTYEIFFKEGAEGALDGLEAVVVSTTGSTINEAKVVASPVVALDYLKTKGFETAFIIGGVTLANAFLSENLIQELFINIEPYIEEGLKLKPADGKFQSLQLLNFKEIEKSGIVQLHYKID